MLNATQGFTYNKFEKPNDWPKIDETFDYKIENGKLLSANEHIYLNGPVTYTKVGNPTIVDGMVSGFSSNDYLGFTSDLNVLASASSWEMVFKIVHAADSSFQRIIGNSGNFLTAVGVKDNKLTMTMNNGSTNIVNSSGQTTLTNGGTYYLKFLFTGTTYEAYLSQDGTTYSLEISKESSIKIASQGIWKIGFVYSTAFLGSIDINETYIKVNDRLWFYGKNYTTKNMVPVPAGLEYNNTTTPSIGWVNTNTDRVKGQHDYVIVGSPTIVNGIVSNFSSSNLIRWRPMNISYEGLKIRIYFTVNEALSEQQTLFHTQKSGGARQCTVSLLTSSSGDFRIRLIATGSISLWDNNLHLSAGTEYYAEAETSATYIKFTVGTDEGGMLYNGSASTTNFASEICYTCDIGEYAQGTPFANGSINMNKSFAILNKFVWAGFAPSEFQQFTAAPKGTMIGKDDTHSLAVETYQDKGIVDYTIVGNPTIVDGVASGFSSSDYATVTPFSALATDEVVEKITFTTGTISGNQWILGRSQNSVLLGVYINSSGKLRIPFIENNGSAISCNLDYVLSANTSYSVIVVRSTNGTLTSTLYDNQETVLDTASTTAQYAFTGTGNIFLGVTASGGHGNSFDGSIDLNHTYIKVNGQYWFHPYPNSYPKLVGPVSYTTVGSPTIVNGVVSGFSSSDYLNISSGVSSNSLEVVISLKDIPQLVNNQGCILRLSGDLNLNVYHQAEGTVRVYYKGSDGNSKYIPAFDYTNDGYFKIVISSTGAKTYYSSDDSSYSAVSSLSIAPYSISFTSARLGYATSTLQAFQGSIDLNQTYIKVNDSLWFGKEDWTPSTYTDNAIYLLGSHKTDYSAYKELDFTPTISDNSTYDLWIDNQKVVENRSQGTHIDWEQLDLSTGYNITTPSALKAHTIKISPSISSKQITGYQSNAEYTVEDGKLVWADPRIYLESTGTQYIDTNYMPVQYDASTVVFYPTSNYSTSQLNTIFSAGTGTYQYIITLGGTTRSVLWSKYFRTGGAPELVISTNGESYKTWFEYTENGEGTSSLKFDDKKLNVSSTYQNELDGNDKTLNLFRSRNNSNYFVGKIKKYSVTNRGLQKLNLVPVPEGLVIGNFTVPSNGMFDLVTQTFFGNQGTGSFTIGKDS